MPYPARPPPGVTLEELHPQQQTSKYQLLSTHVESLTRHYSVTSATGEHDWVFPEAASFEYKQGNYGRAESLGRHAVALMSASWGKEHPDTLTTRNNLALVLQELGRLKEAEAEHRAVLEIQRRVLGEEHPDTLTSRNNLKDIVRERTKRQRIETRSRLGDLDRNAPCSCGSGKKRKRCHGRGQ
ncbi:tetratricopeptide repeat protein [Streptosporangium sp. NPDC002607]